MLWAGYNSKPAPADLDEVPYCDLTTAKVVGDYAVRRQLTRVYW